MAGDPSFDVFRLPEEHDELRAAIRALCEKEIAPYAAAVDEEARFPQEALDALNASGFNARDRRAAGAPTILGRRCAVWPTANMQA